MITAHDKKFIEEACLLAVSNISSGGGPFGAVIAKGAEVIARAGNRVVANTDPTAHAEILAIREASLKLGTHVLEGCTIYTSCEPCPMCLGAIYWSGIGRVIYAAGRSDAAAAGFSDEAIYNQIALPPEARSVEFISAESSKGVNVFSTWENFPGKVPY